MTSTEPSSLELTRCAPLCENLPVWKPECEGYIFVCGRRTLEAYLQLVTGAVCSGATCCSRPPQSQIRTAPSLDPPTTSPPTSVCVCACVCVCVCVREREREREREIVYCVCWRSGLCCADAHLSVRLYTCLPAGLNEAQTDSRPEPINLLTGVHVRKSQTHTSRAPPAVSASAPQGLKSREQV